MQIAQASSQPASRASIWETSASIITGRAISSTPPLRAAAKYGLTTPE